MYQYTFKNGQNIPRFILVAVASWAIALAAITAMGLVIWILYSIMHTDVLVALPKPISLLIGLSGAYAAFGSLCLWMTMWVYWIAVERSSIGVRMGWFFALLLGLHYGAMFYAFRVWHNDIEKTEAVPPNS